MNRLVMIFALFLITIISVSAQPTLPTIPDVTVNETGVVQIEITLSAGPDNGSTTWFRNFSSLVLSNSNNTYAKYTWSTGYNDAGVYNVRFNVSDADSSDTETMTITVLNVNRAPSVTSSPTLTATVGHAYNYTIVATDPDGNTVQYTLGANNPSGMTVNPTTGVVSWTPTTAGAVPVSLIASDGQLSTYQNYTVTVSGQAWSMTLSEPTIGGSSQDREENTTTTMTVTNAGTEMITGITLTSSAVAKYQVVLTPLSIASLAPGASTSITVKGYVPEDKNSGKEKIGTITATGTSAGNQVTTTANLNMQAENNLVIKKVRVTVNDDTDTVDDGDKITVYPASEIQIEVEVKNTIKDLDMEDVNIAVYNDDLDIDEDKDISTIKDGKTTTVTLKFKIDEDADDGKHDVEIIVEGEDENGAKHGETWTLRFDVEEEGIIIVKSTLAPSTLSCQDKSVDLNLVLKNVGTKDEDEAAIEIVATTLKYEKRLSDLSIDEDDEITRSFTIPLKDVASGMHAIKITAFKDFDEQTHMKYVYVTVPSSCVPSTNTTTPPPVPPPVIPPPSDNTGGFVDVGTGTGFSFDMGVWGTILLVLANILVLVIIIILLVKFLL
ncbi:MAG: putative Ig domain-containing protein [Nanoarchaeota archaeon]|nr:putative Ig domain-containing protein [Nanoarchaeota archaeon]MBU1270233.1 putative Ig domain-containing protein [Nanoarchaeota archaeon]MBU1604597.1 putative Ig domain-containing protein [Nanoarchaeota archaeon]MBU2443726.1 putative Ig domain-containing protein [Nanoarchaeota archaeon]